MQIDDFIHRWQKSGGSERANFQQFAIELTQLLGVRSFWASMRPSPPRRTGKATITVSNGP
ncbi:hypothetical protein [Paracoccus actinidiae]|uniref:hypothetical protein n=1 Tax=Paracoccus actinidiae TaxID=3064531 RepID=UPI0027D205A6|nr:hypothetical protein [Paracoccus sp. M09]